MEEESSFEQARVLIETASRGRIDEVVEISAQNRVFSIMFQVPTVEQREDGALSPCWHENQLWGLDRSGRDRVVSAGVIVVVERTACDRGVCVVRAMC
ncbi:hypothetical protein V6N12_024399 [Hibiscus sabdariffa]|uniref:Uncharacterized protein n=1 Tax=Hibiscus sabdariffa TaxID=183260 RepID=A0ABR2G0G5_9ROSI